MPIITALRHQALRQSKDKVTSYWHSVLREMLRLPLRAPFLWGTFMLLFLLQSLRTISLRLDPLPFLLEDQWIRTPAAALEEEWPTFALSEPSNSVASNGAVPDFGGLKLQSLQEDPNQLFGRNIDPQSEQEYHRKREVQLMSMDQDEEEYYLKENWSTVDDQVVDGELECQEPNWRSLMFPTCNTVHELGSDTKSFLGQGTNRMAWLVEPDQGDDEIVLKRLVLSQPNGERHLLKNQRETLILERLSASPRIVNIYGACGTSNLVEAMLRSTMTDITKPGRSWNDDHHPLVTGVLSSIIPFLNPQQRSKDILSNQEMLDLLITMGETIAEMHGFEGGTIFNTDLSPVQFLVGKDGSVKLNDFNSAFIPGWNHKQGRYCKIKRAAWGNPVSVYVYVTDNSFR